jgi:glycosyltransferase involved in cell wall biosynthesis
MNASESVTRSATGPISLVRENAAIDAEACKPLVSLVVPAYNEAALLENHLARICRYMELLEDEYRWEVILVNDGSTDGTGALAEAFARTRDNIHVLHHQVNFGLGQAFKSAFNHCRGDFIVTLDLDLSYGPEHIQKLLDEIRATKAKIVVTSPYMRGGKISNVPWLRRTLSIWANRFLSATAKRDLSTLTSMVRVYDAKFLRTLDLKSMGMEINPEIIYKARLLQARIKEIPAHLDWQLQKAEGTNRRSSMKVLRHTMSVLLSGFLFRPVIFFIIPGMALLSFSLFANAWVFIHFFEHYRILTQYSGFGVRASAAAAAAFSQSPHTFIIGGITLMLAIQLISLGILALQSKSYFEEIFHLGSTIYKFTCEHDKTQA